MKKEFKKIEEDGIVIYDESDDYCEDELADLAGLHLKTNEEIFTDEYMRDYAAKMDAKIAHEKRLNKFISLGVILGCILMIGVFCAYAYYVNFF